MYREGLPFLKARATMTETSSGGRRHGVFSGYRAGWSIPTENGGRTYADGPIELLDADVLPPGATGVIRIYPLVPERWTDVTVGSELDMREGARVVGTAVVTGVFL